MDKLTIINLIKNAYDIANKQSNCNGYISEYKINIKEAYNTTYIEVENKDNQDETWTDKFIYDASTSTLKADNLADTFKINFDNPQKCLRDIGEYVFTAIFQNYYDKSLNEELMNIYLNKDNLDNMIHNALEVADNAYSRYLYEEAAELDYNYDASRKAFSRYSENTIYAKTLTEIRNTLN